MPPGVTGMASVEPLRGSPFGLELHGVTAATLRSDRTAQATVQKAFRDSQGENPLETLSIVYMPLRVSDSTRFAWQAFS